MISEQENTFKDRLSEQQLKEIEETGEFKVKSNVEYITLPYVWRINNTIFWGKDKVHQAWLKNISNIYGYFWSAKKLIEKQIPLQLARVKKLPKSLFRILFGAKSIQTNVAVDYRMEIYKDFWNKILKEYYSDDSAEWFSALWNYIHVHFDPEMVSFIDWSDRKK